MNKDILEGKWKRLQGQFKVWWGKLTDDDLERIGGKFEQFVGLLQEKYGYTREQAETDIDRRITENEARMELLQKKYGYTREKAEEEIDRRVMDPEVYSPERAALDK
jgi:uncharacterized protein YjbJ (UPF0337 family)